MSQHFPTALTVISLVLLGLSAPSPAGAADPKCIPNSSLFPSTEQQDALSRFMCGPNGGTYPSAILGSNLNTNGGSSFNFSPSPASSSRPDNSLLGATFGSGTGLGSDLSPGTPAGASPHENCNRFITPEPGDALSQFMCGPGGGKYLIPGLSNGFPNLPPASSPTTALPTLPTVLPSVSPQPAAVRNEPAKLPTPPIVQVTPAKTETPGVANSPSAVTSTPSPTPPPSPVVAAPLPVAVNPPQKGNPASAPAERPTSIFDNPVFYLAVGILVLVVLAGGLILVTNSGASEEPEASDQEDSD